MPDDCPFCTPDPDRAFLETERVIGLWDRYPVTAGHALIVPRRHVGDWFDATIEERHALMDALEPARAEILKNHQPDGFNIGINIGRTAGQTVFHLHVHLIPRYAGDHADPSGGIRAVIPERARYGSNSE